MCIIKYFEDSWLQTVNGRVTGSWDIYFLCVYVYISECVPCVCVYVEARFQSWLSLLRSHPPCFSWYRIPPWICGSVVRLSWLSLEICPLQVQTQVHFSRLLRYSLWQNNTLVFLFVGMFWGIASHTDLELLVIFLPQPPKCWDYSAMFAKYILATEKKKVTC